MTSLQIDHSQSTSPSLPLDVWTPMAWDQFAQIVERPEHQKRKAYYYQGKMRIESIPTGSDHAKIHAILTFLIGLFAMVKGIPLGPRDACSYRQVGGTDFQPDLSYYIGDSAGIVPGGIRIIDLADYPKPELVIEVSDTTLADDIGEKRLMYEDLRIPEYWVWDVPKAQVIAFSVEANGTSQQIRQSRVLPELSLELLTDALRHCNESDQSAGGAWFMAQLQ